MIQQCAFVFKSQRCGLVDGHKGGHIASEANTMLCEKCAPRELKAMRALESLTASGSEFVGDVEYCVEYIRNSRECQHRVLLQFAKRAKAAEAREQKLREALEYSLKVFRSMSERGDYPRELLPEYPEFMGEQGFGFILEALETGRA